MKILIAACFLSISSLAWSDYEVKTQTHGSDRTLNTDDPSPGVRVRGERKPFEEGIETSEAQEKQEQNANQDLDPELDGIDDDLTEDEGIFDE